jgi:hypothetical protein
MAETATTAGPAGTGGTELRRVVVGSLVGTALE